MRAGLCVCFALWWYGVFFATVQDRSRIHLPVGDQYKQNAAAADRLLGVFNITLFSWDNIADNNYSIHNNNLTGQLFSED